MMDALVGWLKQIILVVLLATFIDLLLPNRTMQRYVKLVVSLFILMTILSPVLQLFGSNANVRMLAATVEGWSVAGTADPIPGGSGGPGASGASMPALGELLSEGERIARERNERSLSMLEDRLEAMVVEHVRTRHEKESSAEATLALDADGLPVVKALYIRVGASLAAAEAASADASAPEAEADEAPPGGLRIEVEPVEVEPVEIEPVRIGERSTEDGGADRDAAAPAPATVQERKAIARSVAEAWSIPMSDITVE